MRRFGLLFIVSLLSQAAIVDRIAIVVDQQIITESQINEEVRVTTMLNRQLLRMTEEERRAAADRLVQQLLVKREMDLGNYPLPTGEEVQEYYDRISQAWEDSDRFHHDLAEYHLTSETLKQHLATQLTTLRFIEYRFRPDLNVSDEEIAGYRKRHPNLAGGISRDAVREALIEERTDQILAAWLEENRKQVNITFLNKALQ